MPSSSYFSLSDPISTIIFFDKYCNISQVVQSAGLCWTRLTNTSRAGHTGMLLVEAFSGMERVTSSQSQSSMSSVCSLHDKSYSPLTRVFSRPYAPATAGTPTSLHYDQHSRVMTFTFLPNLQILQPTEVFIPGLVSLINILLIIN